MTKQQETKYRIRNWKEYKRALIQRGSITLWFSEESIKPGTKLIQKSPKAVLKYTLMKRFYVHCSSEASIIYH